MFAPRFQLIALIIALVCGGAAWATSPIAEVICEPTERMHERLTTRMGGKKTATGIRGPEQIMEVWTDQGGGWTMIVTYATGTSCIVAMGEHWFQEAPA